MKSKRMTLAKIVAVVSFALFAATSCKKSDNGGVDPSSGMAPYLPSVIYKDGVMVDSFFYNQDNTINKIYVDTDEAYFLFDYNNSNQLIRVRKFWSTKYNNGIADNIDTMIYVGQKMTRISYAPKNSDIPRDTTVFTFDSNNSLTFIGSKDTIREKLWNTVYYEEFNTTNGNLTSRLYYNFWSLTDGYNPITIKYKQTYTYDNKPNGLQLVFSKNPWLYIYLNRDCESMLFSGGKNNLTALTNTSDDPETISTTIQNTYDPTTGLVIDQTIVFPSSTSDIRYQFKYIKKK